MSDTQKPPVLEITDLSVDFGVDGAWVPAAKKLNYHIAPGEVVAVVGESGSGKSASSMAILDLLPKNSRVRGSIKLEGEEITGLSAKKMQSIRGSKVSAIFQEPMTALNPVYTVGFQIVETIRVHTNMLPAPAAERAIELLKMVELPDPKKAFDSYPHQLSGGQRQRVMIAQALALDPTLLIADEPTTALDVTVQAEILDLIRNLKDRLNSAVLLITHDMGVVADLADRIVVMRQGEIVEQGDVHQVFAAPKHPYTQALLDAVPHLSVSPAVIDPDAPIVVAPPADTSKPVLTLDKVVIEYASRGKLGAFRAVDEVSFEIRQGEILGLVGESGSGKSTIGRASIGLQPIAGGHLDVADIDLSQHSRALLKKLRRQVGIVFQDPSSSLNPRLPIGVSIGEPMLLAGVAKGAELDRKVESLLDSVKLPRSYRNRFPHELSGGQKQRVGIARALSLKPKLLVADEPTSALDVSVQATVLELLKELQAEMQFACLFITHDLAVVDIMADRIAVMHHGKIVEIGSRDEILRSPKDPYTRRLIAAIPVPDPDAQRARRAERRALLDAGDTAA
ncbi:ABC transporter ATP-binding protein [Mycetocola lacteus]|uniref:ABC transporter ATP-binding protein n=1 Tax=Mycetocola lacteus TaxID=76637 RepID=A0A3L7AVQ8_9MICO|nr:MULTISPECIES: ABC transporter ATP-binding protein [Mycetocola]MCS4275494.1 peptide/nickel transport system ATP-binding protein [Mycetocola sp. BIGb0189]RLP80812.1 ABC transporter ATP-binding protein [Mycetocola lacteus]RLP84597.1 ABC transporter ATP-binding protein [Mycetocola lacteus]